MKMFLSLWSCSQETSTPVFLTQIFLTRESLTLSPPYQDTHWFVLRFKAKIDFSWILILNKKLCSPAPPELPRTTQSRSRGVKMLESHWSNTKNTVLLFVENATSSALIGWKVRVNCRRAFDWSRRNSP